MFSIIAWGVKNIIVFGTSCSLQSDFSLGDVLVCDKSIRNKGTSYNYLSPSKYVYPSEELKQKIIDALKKENIKLKRV